MTLGTLLIVVTPGVNVYAIFIMVQGVYDVNMKNLFAKLDAFLTGYPHLSALLLRLGLATVLLYAAIASTLNPDDWVGYLPGFMRDIAPPETLLMGFSVYELALAAWLLSGVQVRYAALLCAATLGGIVASNFSLLAISFRDIGLMFAAVALAFIRQDESRE